MSAAADLVAPLTEVVVVGRDAPLWLVTLALERALGRAGVTVTAVELPSESSPARVLAGLPPIRALHDKLGIDERALLRATGASYSHGQGYVGRSTAWNAFFHSWAVTGSPVLGQPFFPAWLRAIHNGGAGPLDDYCLAAAAARHGRVLSVARAGGWNAPEHAGLHIGALSYARFLRSLAIARQVRVLEARTLGVELAGDRIASLRLGDGAGQVSGQLFVDVTGNKSLLLGQALGVPLEGGPEWGPARLVIRGRAPPFRSIPPLSEVRVSPAGCTLLHPTRPLTGVVHVHEAEGGDEAGAIRVASEVAGAELEDVSTETIAPCARSQAWRGNCVAIGEAAARLDPIHEAELLVVHIGIAHLLNLLPDTGPQVHEAAEYNRVVRSSFERIRDFQRAFYSGASVDGPFWRSEREAPTSPALELKRRIFAARGVYAPMEDESFTSESWQSLLFGLGTRPTGWPPEADLTNAGAIAASLAQQAGAIRATVRGLPMHDEVLAAM